MGKAASERGVLVSPARQGVTALAFAGEKHDQLYVVCAGKLWVRTLKTKGVTSSKASGRG